MKVKNKILVLMISMNCEVGDDDEIDNSEMSKFNYIVLGDD
jgi:hypothetical protein